MILPFTKRWKAQRALAKDVALRKEVYRLRETARRRQAALKHTPRVKVLA
jgi:hypothetical protein